MTIALISPSRAGAWWPVVGTPVAVALALLVVPAITGLTAVHASALAFAVGSGLVLTMAPRGLASARTWVIAYLLLQFPVRALYLVSAPTERPLIDELLSPGSGLEPALTEALLLSLVGLAIMAGAYFAVMPATGRARPLLFGASLVSWRFFVLLAVASLLLPLERAGGGFLPSLPGLAASGAAAAACYVFVMSPRGHTPVLIMSLAYVGVRVVVLSSKLAAFECLLAVVVALVARSRRSRRLPVHLALTAVVGLVAAVATLLIFAKASGRSEGQDFTGSLEQGATAAVSRSYGVDALAASQARLDAGGERLNGSTFTELAHSWVPRAVWPDKPPSYSLRFGSDVFWFSPQAGMEYFAPSYSGEWLMNFGVVGVIAGWALFGVGAAAVDRIPSLAHRVLWLISVVHLVEGSFVAQVWLAAPFVAGGYWVLRQPRTDPPGLDVVSLHAVPRDEDPSSVLADQVVVEAVVVGDQDDGRRRRQLLGRENDEGYLGADVIFSHLWVAGPDVSPEGEQPFSDDGPGGLPGITDIGLAGQAEQQVAGTVEGDAPAVETQEDAPRDMVGPVVVDVVGEVHATEAPAEVLAHAPGQLAGVDGQAVTAELAHSLEGSGVNPGEGHHVQVLNEGTR